MRHSAPLASGATLSEHQLRGVLRQLIAIGAVAVDGEAFNTLHLTDPVARRAAWRAARSPCANPLLAQTNQRTRRNPRADAVVKAPPATRQRGLLRYSALKAWRAEVARRTTCRPT